MLCSCVRKPEPEETSYTVRCPSELTAPTVLIAHSPSDITKEQTRLARTSNDVPRRLVIVESPAKAKTIAGYLGRGYVVESSVGHIRDLPGGASEVPAKYKGEPWARLGVNVDQGFAPLYVVPRDKKPTLKRLKDLVSDAGAVYLATDEDREGEA